MLITALIAGIIPFGTPTPDGSTAPNVVVLLSDDAGWADFGFHGSTDIATPNLDELASAGVIFDACYVTASVCSPSRAGLLTGIQQQRFGHEYNLPGLAPRPEGGLPLEQQTIADRFKAAGYHTGLIGKWHLGLADHFHPTLRGFDEFRGFRAGSRSYFGKPAYQQGDRALERNGEFVDEESIEYITENLGEEAADFIRQNESHPFFMVVSFNAPHTPMHAREVDLSDHASITNQKRRTYAAMMQSMDRACGMILNTIREQGLEDQTMVIFTNDNGGATNNGSDNGPWRGMKGSLFEGGLRVPAVLRWPGTATPNTHLTEPTSVLDLMATAITAGGADADDLDGKDLSPLLDGSTDIHPRRNLFWRRGPVAAMRTDDAKCIRVAEQGTMLFDLNDDPGETRDLSTESPARTVRMLAMLAQWEAQMQSPRWVTAPVWRKNLLRKHSMEVVGRDAERKLP